MANAKFTVDTHLFRELGELLVGRNSTALIELIKNAYDADATRVTVDGRLLSDSKRGTIVVIDDGVGMNEQQFRDGFLKIASRMKDSGNRKSFRFRRRYTGAKGIGRLAAHKLAQLITVSSYPDPDAFKNDYRSIEASIDWEQIENCLTFDDVEASGAVELKSIENSAKPKIGTVVRLTKLRKKWTEKDLVQFQSEVESFRPPNVFLDVPVELLADEPLFNRPKIAEVGNDDPGIAFELTGEFNTGEDYWPVLSGGADWLI
ncbi:MAG: ATP-binding protein, partial [Schlesneria sp.]